MNGHGKCKTSPKQKKSTSLEFSYSALSTMQKIYYGTIDCLSLGIIFTPVNKRIRAQMSKCEYKQFDTLWKQKGQSPQKTGAQSKNAVGNVRGELGIINPLLMRQTCPPFCQSPLIKYLQGFVIFIVNAQMDLTYLLELFCLLIEELFTCELRSGFH